MSITKYFIMSGAMISFVFSINGFAAKNSQWEQDTVRLQEAIDNSLGYPKSNEQREVSSVEEIREALVLSCEHTPSCTRNELSEIQAGKQPDQYYDEEQGLRNAEMIFRQKGMILQRPK